MRTTLNLDEEVLAISRCIADSEKRSLGDVLSDLARRGLTLRQGEYADEDGFPVFHVDPCAPTITPDIVAVAFEGP